MNDNETRYISPEDKDRHERMLPDQRAVDMAVAMLNTLPSSATKGTRDELIAAIPMYFPGMRRNWWTLDQEVCTVMGVVFLGVNSWESKNGFPDYGWAREQAAQFARKALQGPGVTAWANVSRDGDVAVFTDIDVEGS
jgi:hypothetical protein